MSGPFEDTSPGANEAANYRGPTVDVPNVTDSRAVTPALPGDELLGGAFRPGARLGRFEVEGELGRGGMGVVLRARDLDLGRAVAIKVMTCGEAHAPRFLREGRAAARLRHPGIVTVHELFELDGRAFLVMDLVDGVGLDRLVHRGLLPPRQAVDIARRVAEALAYAHEAGVIHRDLKPANVLLRRDGAPLITDFGVAREIDASRLTASGTIVGTPAYMPLEQLTASSTIDGRADIYALGATLYELLTGSLPIVANSLQELFDATKRVPVPPSRRAPGVDAALDAVVLKCMAPAPADRYATADALAQDLGDWLAGRRISASDEAVATRRRRDRRHVAVGALVVGVALTFAAGVLLLTAEDGRRAVDPHVVSVGLARVAPAGRSLASPELVAAVAALQSDRLALEEALRGAPPSADLRGDLERLDTLRQLVARATTGQRALATLDGRDDPRGAAAELSRLMAAGLDAPELHAWRAELLLAAEASPAEALEELDRAAASSRPDLATPSLRALALLRLGRADAAAALGPLELDVAAAIAAHRARERVTRREPDEALALTAAVAWSDLAPTSAARRAATDLAGAALAIAAQEAGRIEGPDGDAAVRRAISYLVLARRVDPARPAPAPLVRALLPALTSYGRASRSRMALLDLADAAPDLVEAQAAAAGLAPLVGVEHRARVVRVLRRLASLEPDKLEHTLNLALTLTTVGRAGFVEAKAIAAELAELPLGDEDVAASRARLLGAIAIVEQRFADALPLLQAARRTLGYDPGLETQIIIALHSTGRVDEAAAAARAALQNEAGTPLRSRLRLVSAAVLFRSRAGVPADEVHEALEAVLAVSSGDDPTWTWQARLWLLALERGDVAEAERRLNETTRLVPADHRAALERVVAAPGDAAALDALMGAIDSVDDSSAP